MVTNSQEKLIRYMELGRDLLNQINPDWRTKIDPANLDMFVYEKCILGQLYGGYLQGLKALNISVGYQWGFFGDFTYAAFMNDWWKQQLYQ
jgi:hypothetical protein